MVVWFDCISDSFAQVIYRLVDDGIDEQVIMDSSSNPNFQSFQTNTYGDGYDVSKASLR